MFEKLKPMQKNGTRTWDDMPGVIDIEVVAMLYLFLDRAALVLCGVSERVPRSVDPDSVVLRMRRRKIRSKY